MSCKDCEHFKYNDCSIFGYCFQLGTLALSSEGCDLENMPRINLLKTKVNVPKKIDVQIEDLYDWICVHIGFKEEEKEIHKAIKKFGELRYTQGKEEK